MKIAQMNEMAKNANPDMDKEVAEGLSWMGGTFITEYDTPKNEESEQPTNNTTKKTMSTNEFLNG